MLKEQTLPPFKVSPITTEATPPVVLSIPRQKRTSIWSPLSDFWTLGGLSILFCLLVHVASFFKEDLPILQMRFTQVFAVFSFLSIVCNHPHFMISYRLGYGRGIGFIIQNWFSLIVVPVAMIVAYVIAYLGFNTDISQSTYVLQLNSFLVALGLNFTIGTSSQFGAEIMGLSIWLMYFTVGWHYCKQIYGCMMVYSFYNGYQLTSLQKNIFKWSVVSIALYQFTYMVRSMEPYSLEGRIQDTRFQGFYMPSFHIPEWMQTGALVVTALLAVGGLAVLAFNYQKTKKLPPLNFVIPWVAFYVWWIPISSLPEYYLVMVPFFHSLQYLPFALRIENEKIKKNSWYNLQVSVRILFLLAIGLLAFELIPSVLDKKLETDIYQSAWFFTAAFAVFLNIHHFFIDSVVWKLKDQEVRNNLLYN